MNIAYEFSKIKDSFKKVKNDMQAMADKINENYEDFWKKHGNLTKEIEKLSSEMQVHLANFRTTHLQSKEHIENSKEILTMKSEIRELKEILNKTFEHNLDIKSLIDSVKKNEATTKVLKERLQSSELEIFLLKERIVEKNVEIKQMKEISSHILKIIDDLSSVELEILNKTN